MALSVLLLVAYALGLLFSLKTHRELFAGAEHGESGETVLPIGVALGTLAVVTLCVALVSELFVESVQQAALAFGMTPAFVGFVVVALVGGAAGECHGRHLLTLAWAETGESHTQARRLLRSLQQYGMCAQDEELSQVFAPTETGGPFALKAFRISAIQLIHRWFPRRAQPRPGR